MSINQLNQSLKPRNLLLSFVVLFGISSMLSSCVNEEDPISEKIVQIYKPEVNFLSDGSEILSTLITSIEQAQDSINIKMFIWKNDAIGRKIARALIKAGDRGVKVTIEKDRTGIYTEGEEALLHKDMTYKEEIVNSILVGDIKSKTSTDLQDILFSHEFINIDNGIIRGNHCGKAPCPEEYEYKNNHSKVIRIDNNQLFVLTGNFSNELLERNDSGVHIIGDNVTHSKNIDGITIINNEEKNFQTKNAFINLIENATQSINIEMAYIGDIEIRETILKKAKNSPNVVIKILLPAESDVQDDLNKQEISIMKLFIEREGLNNITIFGRSMTHNKLVNSDKNTYIGSANFNSLSTSKMGEVGIIIDGNIHNEAHEKIMEKILCNQENTTYFKSQDFSRIKAYRDNFFQ